jgi:hypothetical protein
MKNVEEQLNEFKTLLTDETVRAAPDYAQRLHEALKQALTLLIEVSDENGTLWLMLEEQKASEIENHKTLVRKELDRKISETLMFSKSKIVKA